jgi:glycosyltransferase involved in cell wall biosynthesis
MHCPALRDLPPPPEGKTGWPWTEESDRLPNKMSNGHLWSKISIVTPSYNQAQFIEETIRSVLLQGYPNIEYIIVDGGSTDTSVGIIQKYEPWLAYWVSKPDQGQSHAINKGIAKATGKLLIWLNSDDLLLPNALPTFTDLFVQNSEVRIFTGQAYTIDKRGYRVGRLRSHFSSWEDFATRKCMIRQVSTCFHRSLLDELGLIDESLEYAMDSDLLLRFTRLHTPIVIDNLVAAYRMHEATKFDHNPVDGYREADMIYLKHLKGTDMRPKYIEWSARNWLNQSSRQKLGKRKRFLCLCFSLRRKPSSFFNRDMSILISRAVISLLLPPKLRFVLKRIFKK